MGVRALAGCQVHLDSLSQGEVKLLESPQIGYDIGIQHAKLLGTLDTALRVH